MFWGNSFKMVFLFCLVLILPYALGADLKSILCPDGTACRAGTTCVSSELTEKFECEAIPQEVLLNKKIFSGMASHAAITPVITTDVCENGTICDKYKCCPTIKMAVCCKNSNECCPEKFHCCSNTTSWCCPQNTRCHTTDNLCIAGASALSPSLTCAILAFLLLAWKIGVQQGI